MKICPLDPEIIGLRAIITKGKINKLTLAKLYSPVGKFTEWAKDSFFNSVKTV